MLESESKGDELNQFRLLCRFAFTLRFREQIDLLERSPYGLVVTNRLPVEKVPL